MLEATRVGGGTSGISFAWTNSSNKTPRAYHDLNVAGMRAHAALKDEFAATPWWHGGGRIEWRAEAEQAALKAKVERLRSWDYEAEWIDRKQLLELEPDIAPEAIGYIQLAILAIFVQALSPNKFVGWAVMVVYIIATIVSANLGFDHMLYRYGQAPGVPLSDMNGTGDFSTFAAWANSYWLAFGVVLLVLVYGLWRRGTETRLLPRLKRLPQRLMGPAGVVGAAALATFGTFAAAIVVIKF